MNRAVFLDRDGTIIQEKEFLRRVEDVALLPGSVRGLQQLRDHGFQLFIVSNQSGVGRGYFTLADVAAVNEHLVQTLAAHGIHFKKIYVAPEAPDVPSRGRKPSPQFLFDARDEFDVELGQSYVIGDKLIDLQCGWNAGVKKSLLVRTGYGRQGETDLAKAIEAAVVVDDLAAAAEWIIGHPQPARA